LETLDVLALNCEQRGPFNSISEQTPPIPLLASIFNAYMSVFTNYTEHFVLYYLYSQE
jgi:hypothetical protein